MRFQMDATTSGAAPKCARKMRNVILLRSSLHATCKTASGVQTGMAERVVELLVEIHPMGCWVSVGKVCEREHAREAVR